MIILKTSDISIALRRRMCYMIICLGTPIQRRTKTYQWLFLSLLPCRLLLHKTDRQQTIPYLTPHSSNRNSPLHCRSTPLPPPLPTAKFPARVPASAVTSRKDPVQAGVFQPVSCRHRLTTCSVTPRTRPFWRVQGQAPPAALHWILAPAVHERQTSLD